jgi:hypothetical protein
MSGLRDDDLRAMLEARAARATEPTTGIRRSTEPAVGPVTARRWSTSVPLLALGLVLVLVVGAVGIGRLGDGPAATRGSADIGTPSSAPGDEWSYQQLAAALGAGRLARGSVVLLRGALEQAPCEPIRPATCLDVRIRGLDTVDISSDLPVPFEQLLLEGGNHAGGALMALRVEGSRLRFLGWPDRDPADPVALDKLPLPPDSPATLVPVSGWLGGPAIPAACPEVQNEPNEESICFGRPAVVAASADAAMRVPAPPDALRVGTAMLVDPDPAPGPVLLSRSGGSCITMSADAWKPCDGPPIEPWNALAALGAAPVIRVAAPSSETTPPPPGSTPISVPETDAILDEPAFHAALAQGALDGRLIEVAGAGAVSMSMCDAVAGASCEPILSWGIGAIENGGGISVTGLPCVSHCPDGWPGGGPYLFVVRGTILVYLGTLRGSLGAPERLSEDVVRALTQSDDPHAVHSVDGWFTPLDMRVSAGPPGAQGLSTDPAWWMGLSPEAVGTDGGDAAVEGPLLIGAASRVKNDCQDTNAACAAVPVVLGRYDPSRVVRVTLE